MASDLQTITALLTEMESRLTRRMDDLETKLLTANASNLEDCVNTIEAVGESIRGMITADGIRRKTQRVTTAATLESFGKRLAAVEEKQRTG